MKKSTSKSQRWPGAFHCSGSAWLEKHRGNATSAGAQRWRAQINYKTPEDVWRNKLKAIWASGMRDAERQFVAWCDAEEEVHERRERTGSDVCINEYIANYIVTREKGRQVEPSTIADDRKKSRQVGRLLPDMSLDCLRSKDAEAMVARILAEDVFGPDVEGDAQRCCGSPLAPSSGRERRRCGKMIDFVYRMPRTLEDRVISPCGTSSTCGPRKRRGRVVV